MKTRLGFVSNSSASSYIIAFNPKDFEICDKCGRGSKDPLTLIRESSYFRLHQTEFDCASGEERIEQLMLQIEEMQKEIKEALNRPAGEIYDPNLANFMGVEDSHLIPKVWNHISHCDHSITFLKRQIKIIERKLLEGKQIFWAAIYYDDPTGKILEKMIEDGLVEQVKDV